MSLKIKICGMRDPDNIAEISALRPDMMGFIFYPPSKRYAGSILEPSHLSRLSPEILKTGVFVNEAIDQIISTVTKYSLDLVQLHGTESPDLCRSLKEKGIMVIKTFSISENYNFKNCAYYASCTDYFLFDTSTPGFGGSGNKFSWDELKNYNHGHPFIISGGISPADADKISDLSLSGLYGIDLNSRFEIKPGLKNSETLRNFIEAIRNND